MPEIIVPAVTIKDNLIDGKALYKRTPNSSGRFSAGRPTLLVMHYTAGANGQGAADFLCLSSTQASAHVVVDREGLYWQILPFNEMAWHAGPSSWRGQQYCNQYSIGIEIDNYGFAHKHADGVYYNAYGGAMDSSKIIDAAHKNGGGVMGWEVYNAKQLAAVEALTRAILLAYPTITDIAGHDDVAPQIKVDPGPAFPMQRFKNLLSAPRSAGAIPDKGQAGAPEPAPVVVAAQERTDKLQHRTVTASLLNVRGGQGTNFDTLSFGPLPYGTDVEVLQDAGDWSYIQVGGDATKRGWVFDQYLAFKHT